MYVYIFQRINTKKGIDNTFYGLAIKEDLEHETKFGGAN